MSYLLPVILSGGSGSRLWPLSRETHPKQLLSLVGEASMLQQTALRTDALSGHVSVAAPCVVCNADYRFITAEQLLAVGKTGCSIVLEPFGRNTAPALTLAALQARADDSDPLLLVMPADHVVADSAGFERAIRQGLPAARDGAMLTFGIVPTRAQTGYGYLRQGPVQPDGSHALDAFVEKPDATTATQYLASGQHLWNSGLFLMRASVWLRAIGHFRPDMLAACQAATQAARHDADFVRICADAFESCPADSIDYAVMEKLASAPGLGIPARVVPMDAGWSDVGAWDALWDVMDKDAAGNASHGQTLLQDTSDSLVFASSRLVASVGLSNTVVVETPDAVLVADKRHTQDVKKIVERLKAEGRPLANAHRKVHRPWGWYDSIDSGERFQVKRIVVKPGASLSLQLHHHRAEHWVVVRGTAQVTSGDKTFLLAENQSTYIPVGYTHRLSNPGKVPLEIIEVQSGSYLGEDDIVRLDDDYGRSSAVDATPEP